MIEILMSAVWLLALSEKNLLKENRSKEQEDQRESLVPSSFLVKKKSFGSFVLSFICVCGGVGVGCVCHLERWLALTGPRVCQCKWYAVENTDPGFIEIIINSYIYYNKYWNVDTI